VILATNQPQRLDEAMRRRIRLEEPFGRPDPNMRRKIWRAHLPDETNVDPSVDIDALADRYELTGGLIKNAVLTAVDTAVARGQEVVTLTQGDLVAGAQSQLKGSLRLAEFDRKIVPSIRLDDLVLPDSLRSEIQRFIRVERLGLFAQWGFEDSPLHNAFNRVLLLHGPPGTGKTSVAEAIGYELGRPLRLIQPTEVFSKWVGEAPKTVEAIFDEARHNNAILLFDEADALFGKRTDVRSSTDRYANADVSVLLRRIEDYDGIAILTTNVADNIDPAMRRRFRYDLAFEMPGREERLELWKRLIPDSMPMGSVDYDALAGAYEFTGAQIRNVIYRAAAKAASRSGKSSAVGMRDLQEAAAEEQEGSTRLLGFQVNEAP